jgi:hypothetical protein
MLKWQIRKHVVLTVVTALTIALAAAMANLNW